MKRNRRRIDFIASPLFACLALLAASLATTLRVAAQTPTLPTSWSSLHAFGTLPQDGALPMAPLIQATNGRLYGTTWSGAGAGTVFAINPDGTDYTILHQAVFQFGEHGFRPTAPLVQARNGRIYGTMSSGGNGTGAVFALDADGSRFVTLHKFGPESPRRPVTGLVQAPSGRLYGLLDFSGDGMLYSIFPDGSGYRIHHTFKSTPGDGSGPNALIVASDGIIYGTTYGGGADDSGTIFSFNEHTQQYRVLLSFRGAPPSPRRPNGLIEASGGRLFGTSEYGGAVRDPLGYTGGALFSVARDGSDLVLLHSFGDTSRDGAFPTGSLIEASDGRIYGTTAPEQGAQGQFAAHGDTIFSVAQDGGDYRASASVGRIWLQGMIQGQDGNFYVTARVGATPSRQGALYRVTTELPARPAAPVLATSTPVSAMAGADVAFTIDHTSTGARFSALGLPPGLSVDPARGIIAGKARTPGVFNVTILAANLGGSAVASLPLTVVPAQLANSHTDRLLNLSARSSITAADILIAGFAMSGSTTKPMLVRGIGPGLRDFGVATPVSYPRLEVFSSSGILGFNAGWAGDAAIAAAGSRVGAFPLTQDRPDAAMLSNLAPGSYTAHLSATRDSAGVALAEIYDPDPSTAERLVNLSVRAQVHSGDGVLIAGFVVGGGAPKRILIRGIGPALRQFGVNTFVADPRIRLFNADRQVIAQNDDWETPQPLAPGTETAKATDFRRVFTAVGAFVLEAGSKDSALLVDLAPGSYTAEVSNGSGGPAVGLVEVYDVVDEP